MWVCVFGLGFRLRSATPGWGVGLCACSACTQPILARVQEAGGTRQPIPAASIHRPNYPDGLCFLPLNPSVEIWVKLASLLPFFFDVRLHPFFSCLNGIDSFLTSTTTK